MSAGLDAVFKALADPTRRLLLDRLHEHNGQTLGELCRELGMARQSATQHLALLEAANLISTVRRGRQKWHYLNPVPLHAIQERWIDKFERPRLRALSEITRRAEEEMSDRPSFVYTTYIDATPDAVWRALTDAELTAAYWGHANVSDDWRPGARWEHRRTDGSGLTDGFGEVLESDPPHRLVFTWSDPEDPKPGTTSRVSFDVVPHGRIVRLTVTHEDLTDQAERDAAAGGWAAVLANLKTLLETGSVLPEVPWEEPAPR